MSAATDPGLPQDPADFSRRPRLRLWTAPVFVAVGLVAGAGLAAYVPGLLPKAPTAVTTPPPAARPQPAVAVLPPAAPAPAVSDGEVERLKAKVAELESAGVRSTAAVSAALAAADLIDVTRTSRPFAGELAALRTANPDLPELAALATIAERGAPSRGALAASFPAYAARAAVAARAPGDDSAFSDRATYMLVRLVAVRRVSNTTGSTPDAVLARAEAQLAEGDVPAALTTLSALPPKAQAALAPWTVQAQRRAEIDRQVAALRQRAAAELVAQPEAKP